MEQENNVVQPAQGDPAQEVPNNQVQGDVQVIILEAHGGNKGINLLKSK